MQIAGEMTPPGSPDIGEAGGMSHLEIRMMQISRVEDRIAGETSREPVALAANRTSTPAEPSTDLEESIWAPV